VVELPERLVSYWYQSKEVVEIPLVMFDGRVQTCWARKVLSRSSDMLSVILENATEALLWRVEEDGRLEAVMYFDETWLKQQENDTVYQK
jgi:hypothetical protein